MLLHNQKEKEDEYRRMTPVFFKVAARHIMLEKKGLLINKVLKEAYKKLFSGKTTLAPELPIQPVKAESEPKVELPTTDSKKPSSDTKTTDQATLLQAPKPSVTEAHKSTSNISPLLPPAPILPPATAQTVPPPLPTSPPLEEMLLSPSEVPDLLPEDPELAQALDVASPVTSPSRPPVS